MKGQQTPSRFPKINQFETQFSHLSLSNFQEQKHNPSICKGMLSMINPKPPCENKKIKQSSQFEQKAHCLKRCPLEEGTSFDLDLAVFKIRPCQRQCEHNHKQCPYFHSEGDLRRPGTYYKAELCPYKLEQKECPHGYSCCKAHNQYELLYQEDNYRKLFCPQPQNCCFGMYCPYAHFEKDIKCELIHLYQHDQDYYMFHYKTVACPYSLFNHNLVIYNLIRSTCDYYSEFQFHQLSQCVKTIKLNQQLSIKCIIMRVINAEEFKILIISLNNVQVGCKISVVLMNVHFVILSLNFIFILLCIKPLNVHSKIVIVLSALDIMMKMIKGECFNIIKDNQIHQLEMEL